LDEEVLIYLRATAIEFEVNNGSGCFKIEVRTESADTAKFTHMRLATFGQS